MRLYFLGICGVSMSALAVLCKDNGHEVAGSDIVKGAASVILEEAGISVDYEINLGAISSCDEVVVSSAIKRTDPRLVFAKKIRKKITSRGQLLGRISDDFENVIAVAGSHGKTTTTAMIYEILSVSGKNPTLHLGGFRVSDGKNFVIGEKKFFVTEACEYCDNFLFLHPQISVITNVEKEHMDFFKTFSREVESFEKFKKNSRFVIDSKGIVSARNVRHGSSGELLFDLCTPRKSINLHMKICEEVNTENAIFAYLVCKKLGISDSTIKLGLESFKGVQLRFERMNCPDAEICICDYAHHPTEISKAIATMKKLFCGKELVVIFQPHTYSRTKALLTEFVQVFESPDVVVIFKTYAAREKEENGISGEKLAKIMQKTRKNVLYFDNFALLREFLSEHGNAALLFVGAGDLPAIAQKEGFFNRM